MRKSEQDLRVYHRPRLSARASNYADVVRPPSWVVRDGETQQVDTTKLALQTADLIHPDNAPSAQPDQTPEPPKAKRKRGLRDSIYGHSGLHAPKTRRQKKINKAISFKDMSRSPLSGIAEMTDSTANDLPMPVELPAERTPNFTTEPDSAVSPLQSNPNWFSPAQKPRPEHLSPLELDTPISLKRGPSFKQTAELQLSPSKSSVFEAPDSPLPPLPAYQLYHQPSGAKRSSQLLTLTIGSSVLGGLSPPSELNGPQTVNSGMQQFDFGFSESPSARFGPSPGRQTGWHGGRNVTSVVPCLDLQGQQTCATSTADVGAESGKSNHEKGNSIEWIPSPDFVFGKPNASPARNTLDSPIGKPNSNTNEYRHIDGNVSPTLLLPRPASVASSQPFWPDQTPTFARTRLSVSSAGSGNRNRGHRRQNCVRIRIPTFPVSPMRRRSAMTRRPSNILEAVEGSEEEASESPSKVRVVEDSLNNSSNDRKHLSARRSIIVNANGSPNAPPMARRETSTNQAKIEAAFLSPSSGDSGSPRPDSDVFWSHNNDSMESPKKAGPFAYPDRWALMPTRPSSIGLELGIKLSVFEHPNSEEDSPILLSPCKPLVANSSATRPKDVTRPLGPRQVPAFPSTDVNIQHSPSKISSSTVPGTGPSSPSRHVSVKYDPEDPNMQDLRLSVAQLRYLDSSGRRLNSESKLWTAGDTPTLNRNHEEWKQLNALWEVSRSNSVNSLSTRATPGAPTQNNSTTASVKIARKNSMPRTNTGAKPSLSMFGSSKRKIAQPDKLAWNENNGSVVFHPVPLVSSNSSRLRRASTGGSPSRNSSNSLGNDSI